MTDIYDICLSCFKTGSCYVYKIVLKLKFLLPPYPNYWDYKCTPTCPAESWLVCKPLMDFQSPQLWSGKIVQMVKALTANGPQLESLSWWDTKERRNYSMLSSFVYTCAVLPSYMHMHIPSNTHRTIQIFYIIFNIIILFFMMINCTYIIYIFIYLYLFHDHSEVLYTYL